MTLNRADEMDNGGHYSHLPVCLLQCIFNLVDMTSNDRKYLFWVAYQEAYQFFF